ITDDAAAAISDPCPATGAAGSSANLTVTVQYVVTGGASPPPGQPPHVSRSAAAGISVIVVPAGDATATPVASGVTDATGVAAFSAAPGSYWVIVPPPAPNTPAASLPLSFVLLPDGTRAQQWAAVDVAAGIPQAITLSLTVFAP
ncbi:MAG: hypothetical protein ACYDCQ_09810, partial [Dehalococcoidia bacterium]